jgi:hypothetical protein
MVIGIGKDIVLNGPLQMIGMSVKAYTEVVFNKLHSLKTTLLRHSKHS